MQNTFLFLIIIGFFSCSSDDCYQNVEIENLIKHEFGDDVVWNKLIPLSTFNGLNYSDAKAWHLKEISLTKPLSADPPSLILNEEVVIGPSLINNLFHNFALSQIQFDDLLHQIKVQNSKIHTLCGAKFLTQKILTEVLNDKDSDSYREIGYPLKTDKLIIIYTNFYYNIKEAPSLGLEGYGEFIFYMKKDHEWKIVHRLTHWIT